MSQACSGESEGHAPRRTGALRAAHGLALAASPTFAVMALLTGVLGTGQAQALCSFAEQGSLSGGMITMYVLMSTFHAAPWLRLVRTDAHRLG